MFFPLPIRIISFSRRNFYVVLFNGSLIIITLIILGMISLGQKDDVDRSDVDANGVLYDILDAPLQPKPQKSIFFVATHKCEDDVVTLNARKACAIESAAFHHPNREIFVILPSANKMPDDIQSTNIAALHSYKNVHFRTMNIGKFVTGTPHEELEKNRTIYGSPFMVEHMSDFLRKALLYKYGGIYFDTDVIVQKNLDGLPANFIGKESCQDEEPSSVNGAILGIQDDVGHEIIELCLIELAKTYDPDAWAFNGPQLITRVLENQVCHTNIREMTPEKCRGFKVYPFKEFYPISYGFSSDPIHPGMTEQVLEKTKNASVVHFWNSHTKRRIITKSSTTPTAYEVIAEKNCPKVFQSCGEQF